MSILGKNSGKAPILQNRLDRLGRKVTPPGALIVLAALVTLVPLACGPKAKVDSEERTKAGAQAGRGNQSQPAAKLIFDPLSLERDRSIITDMYRDSLKDHSDSNSAAQFDTTVDSVTPAAVTAAQAYDTYRIQLFNSLVFTEATLEKNVAQEIFDYTATLDYEVPYFKVRIGDFPERKTAVAYLEKFVKPAGYRDGWVTRVRIEPEAGLVTDSALAAYYDSLRTEMYYSETLGVWVDTLDDTAGDTLDDD